MPPRRNGLNCGCCVGRGSRPSWRSSGPRRWCGHRQPSANTGFSCRRGIWRLRERGRRCPAWPGRMERAFTALGERPRPQACRRRRIPASRDIAAGPAGPRNLARHMVMGLTVQFLLGMAVSLPGQPSQASGAARPASTVLLVANTRHRRRHDRRGGHGHVGERRPAEPAAAAGDLGRRCHHGHRAAGILTTITKSNWWSCLMALDE